MLSFVHKTWLQDIVLLQIGQNVKVSPTILKTV